MATQINVTPADIKSMYPQTSGISDEILQVYIDEVFDMAQTSDCACNALHGNARKRALVLLALHFYELINGPIVDPDTGSSDNANSSGAIEYAKVGDVAVKNVTPTNNNSTEWFLNQTVWGTKLLFLLKLQAPAGFVMGGHLIRTFAGDLKYQKNIAGTC